MTLLNHELRRGRLSMLIWAAGLSFMLGICILIYPEMAGQMEEMNAMFADMGNFTAAFGMDQLNFGEFKGYFGIECGNTLGIGGAIFAALLGISAISKEEKDHTAEFLLTHPISRTRVFAEKLLAIIILIISLNCIVIVITLSTTWMIGETLPLKETLYLFLTFTLLQIEIAGITFGLSAYLKGNGIGIGLGYGLGMYLINLIANLVEQAKFIKYITPFAYADSATIYSNGSPEIKYILSGVVLTTVVLTTAGWHYKKKDIQ